MIDDWWQPAASGAWAAIMKHCGRERRRCFAPLATSKTMLVLCARAVTTTISSELKLDLCCNSA